jgi:hypothetical protein
MKAKLMFLVLSDAQYNEVNAKGWDGAEWTGAYLGATFGKTDAIKKAMELGLYTHVASLDVNEKNPELVWMKTQNLTEKGWVQDAVDADLLYYMDPSVFQKAGTKSMSVGDFIEWEDGTKEVVKSIGFEAI